ncbi:MAG: RNA polymerase sigma factor [Chthoniobacteraceae bacterium]|nr:RNA polymerase sigma factor [Chthoniobacteraceae bacterium]
MPPEPSSPAPSDDLERLYDAHAAALFAWVLSITQNESDCRDVLQEVFARIAIRPGLLAGVRDERAFLLRLAKNTAFDLRRRRSAREKYHAALAGETPLFQESPNPDEAAFRRALSEALAGLPPEQRAVVHLKLWEEATFEEIAEILGIPANTAASRYRYALDKLRARLRPLYDEIV